VNYWKRRFLVLAAGLAILAPIAWGFSGAVGASLAAGAGHGSPRHRAHPAGAALSGTRFAGTSDSRAVTIASPPSPALSQGAAPSGPVRACHQGDVVLSLFSGQASYGAGQLPEFEVDVVSTSSGTCAFNVGPGFLALVITADGKRVWSSADCVAGQGSLQADLARGVPTAVPLSWDREASSPGCKASPRQVTAGSFAAAASDAGLVSNSLTFKLS
jgi:hypothetical protein